MKPSQKSEGMEQFFLRATGIDRRASIEGNICTFCRNPAESFRNAISEKEFSISGLCQECQDATFGVD